MDKDEQLAEHDGRLREIEALLGKLEGVFVEHFLNGRKVIVPADPPSDLIRAMAEIRQGKNAKTAYLLALYRTIYNHFRDIY